MNLVQNGFIKEAKRFIGKTLQRDLPSLKVRLRWLKKHLKSYAPKNLREIKNAFN